MLSRLGYIAFNTFREAVRDRVLYNLVFFALLMVGSAPLFGQISIGLERIVLVNLGLTAITLFGVVIAIFIGIGLVSKEIEKRTLYTVLSRPVRRWEFICGKYLGLACTLIVNAFFMALGLFLAVLYVKKGLSFEDAHILVALYLIILQLLVITAITLLFSSFSSPLLSALFTFGVFVIGNFVDDLRGFAMLADGVQRWVVLGLSYLVPNFGSMNVVSQVAHGEAISASLVGMNTLYAALYTLAALSGAVLIFERRNLK
ncbi:MAG TPA: ABC transporter permease subunit [Terriglobales bacterium]|nr:ABC transporter permease subunit [Terriglobales bacterium]